MKGDVVAKHLALMEPLEKENLSLKEKVERLEAILAAGDRVARAAATFGEKREINTLAEEDEEEDFEDTTPGAQSSQQSPPPREVLGTQLAAMQETLSQLSDLNNEAIAESSRTAQKLAGDEDSIADSSRTLTGDEDWVDWVPVENKSDESSH
ncbi:hypothetical protein BDV95DRAFT_74821 [Massariosphaeria phaeospora]|uniref:Uncharacterized protein n=1 Tax=Massariosphaeria phaeospora TaxID=100035 RepID=A0A7C8I3R6_9PLEO|nr:hypothetical protein BDV95DRAFT_74821 [Massariosphaeria phaeospora]